MVKSKPCNFGGTTNLDPQYVHISWFFFDTNETRRTDMGVPSHFLRFLRFFLWFCCKLCIDSVVLYTYPVISTLTQLGLAGNQQQLRTTSTSSARCKVIPIACWAFLWRTPLSRSRRNGWRTLPRATRIGWHGEQKSLKVAKFIYIYITQKQEFKLNYNF